MAVTQAESRQPELEYLPSTADLADMVQSTGAGRVLLVGLGEVVDLAAQDVRVVRPPGPVAANGIYVFRTAGRADLMVCRGGGQPGMPLAGDESNLDNEHPLLQARTWFEFLWPQATPVGGAPQFAVGEYVKVAGSGQIGRVEERLRSEGQNAYKVSIDGQVHRVGEGGLTGHEIDPDDVRTWLKSEPATARDLSVGLTLTKLTNPLTDTIYSYLSSKTVYRPYQFRPVLRLLQSQHQRLLIADEVGLGKTIEAGLIWTELEARNDGMNRVLIVCPAMLVPKWRDEMRRRFDREVTELDKVGMSNLISILENGEEDKQVFGVVSLERLRNKKLVTELNDLQPRFDLVIVDEAHYLRNSSTRSYALGEILSEWAETLLFLSATPPVRPAGGPTWPLQTGRLHRRHLHSDEGAGGRPRRRLAIRGVSLYARLDSGRCEWRPDDDRVQQGHGRRRGDDAGRMGARWDGRHRHVCVRLFGASRRSGQTSETVGPGGRVAPP